MNPKRRRFLQQTNMIFLTVQLVCNFGCSICSFRRRTFQQNSYTTCLSLKARKIVYLEFVLLILYNKLV
uniref:Uncharacterized protein n=1 Tax=Arundo donax TaxID=35708 RepID=A0A0A9BQN9_ARUDO